MMSLNFMTVLALVFGALFAVMFFCLVQAVLYLQRAKAEIEQATSELRSQVNNLIPDEAEDRLYRKHGLRYIANLARGGSITISAAGDQVHEGAFSNESRKQD